MALNTQQTIGNINGSVAETVTLVTKANGKFLPLFSPQDVSRDKFIQLRKELITLGCNQSEVIAEAKRLSMEVLDIKHERDYHAYIMNQTYQLCKKNIQSGCSEFPVQDLNNPAYSHINLFSSIYGFEINYLKSKRITQGVADIGCGDGLFLRLLADEKISATGYEIEIKQTRHDVSISEISDVSGIKTFHPAIILNHVLEHIDETPSEYLHRLITHMNSLSREKLKVIIISLPLHLSLYAHLAADHRWVCYNDDVPLRMVRAFEQEGLRFYIPDEELLRVAQDHGYKLSLRKNIGVYVIE